MSLCSRSDVRKKIIVESSIMGSVIIMFPLIEFKIVHVSVNEEIGVQSQSVRLCLRYCGLILSLLLIVITFWHWPHQSNYGIPRFLLPEYMGSSVCGGTLELLGASGRSWRYVGIRKGAAKVIWALKREYICFTSQKTQIDLCTAILSFITWKLVSCILFRFSVV